jgi:hypothetical protein
MFWAVYAAAWFGSVFFLATRRRGTAGLKGEVMVSRAPAAYQAVLLLFDWLLLPLAFSLYAVPFFVMPFGPAAAAAAGVFVGASLAAGSILSSMQRRVEFTDFYLKFAVPLGLATLVADSGVWLLVARTRGWL